MLATASKWQAPAEAEQRLLLSDISWESYEKMLDALQRRPGTRLTYAEGMLEIRVVSFEHEKYASFINSLIEIVAVELGKDYIPAGSTTFKLKPKERGFEPDGCFYFSYLKELAKLTKIDLQKDPPPDLTVEVDIGSPSISRFPIFARFGVKEVWRYHEGALHIYQLRGVTYVKVDRSKFLPGVIAAEVTQLINARNRLSAVTWQRKVRSFAQEIGKIVSKKRTVKK